MLSKLTDSALKAFYPAKLFSENTDSINSLHIDDSGEFLISGSDDDTIIMYNCLHGKYIKSVNSKKYGCENVRFTHNNSCILHSSNKLNDAIRYLSLHNNSYIRYFEGHENKVLDVCMSPLNDTFASVSLDGSIRVWDLRSPDSQGCTHPTSNPTLIKMDPKGLIFCVTTLRKTLLLYDLRSYDRGPFHEFSVPISSKFGPPEPPLIETSSLSSFEFSADGSKIATLALNEIECVVSVMDSFEGRIFNCTSSLPPWGFLDQIKNPDESCQKLHLNITSTPNSNYFLTFLAKRQRDLHMQAWKFDNGQSISLFDPCVNKNTCTLSESVNKGYHSTISIFNHKYMMMASTCDNNLILWQPDLDKNL